MTTRRDFLRQPAPENYVAGLGRGATGFTTRSDLGPAREGPSEDQIKAEVAKRSAKLGLTEAKDEDNDKDEARYQDPDNEHGLFAGGIYEKDDEDADHIWQEVDEKMGRRRKKQREEREKAEQEQYDLQHPKIQTQFAGLKRALETVTDEEWANLPDAKDFTGRAKRARRERMERFYAVPDSVLAAGRDAGQMGTTVVDDGPGGEKDGTVTDFAKFGAARDKVLQSRLEQAVQGSATSIDPKGYLTSLDNAQGATAVQSIGDIEQFRKMLKSAIDSNPKQAASWIAAARLEIAAGKPGAARTLLQKACNYCKGEDIYIERIHINDVKAARVIAAEAIRENIHSVKLWVEAMKLENDPRSRKTVLRKALESNPESEMLWKEAVNLESDPNDAKLLLSKATELIPQSLDLWQALAHLETPDNARKILNKAVKKLPTSHELWIAAARLEEQLGEGKRRPVMKNAVKFLAKQGAMPKREEWIAEAEKCEADGAVITCSNIIEETLGFGLDEEDDRKDIFLEDAKGSINRGYYATARAIYAYALRVFPTSKSLYQNVVEMEKNHGTKESLCNVLEKAVEACPQHDFWITLARVKAELDLDEARKVLGRAFRQNGSEEIWVEAIRMEAEQGLHEQARALLSEARQKAPTDRIWMKSVAFERQLQKPEEALSLVNQALQLFPSGRAPKLHMLKGQVYEDLGKVSEAREAYAAGVRACPKAVPLYLLYARLEEREGNVVKCRSVLERARTSIPESDQVTVEIIRFERRVGNLNQAKSLMADALRRMPKSGLLWSERILNLEQRTQRKTLLAEAIKKVEDDPLVLITAARVLWAERKLDRAQNWFEKSLVPNSDLGDAWAWYYSFLLQHGTPEKRAEVAAKCVLCEPKHGEAWQPIAKDPRNAGKKTEEILKLVASALA